MADGQWKSYPELRWSGDGSSSPPACIDRVCTGQAGSTLAPRACRCWVFLQPKLVFVVVVVVVAAVAAAAAAAEQSAGKVVSRRCNCHFAPLQPSLRSLLPPFPNLPACSVCCLSVLRQYSGIVSLASAAICRHFFHALLSTSSLPSCCGTKEIWPGQESSRPSFHQRTTTGQQHPTSQARRPVPLVRARATEARSCPDFLP